MNCNFDFDTHQCSKNRIAYCNDNLEFLCIKSCGLCAKTTKKIIDTTSTPNQKYIGSTSLQATNISFQNGKIIKLILKLNLFFQLIDRYLKFFFSYFLIGMIVQKINYH